MSKALAEDANLVHQIQQSRDDRKSGRVYDHQTGHFFYFGVTQLTLKNSGNPDITGIQSSFANLS